MKLMTKVYVQIVVHYMIYFTYDNLKEKCALRMRYRVENCRIYLPNRVAKLCKWRIPE